MRAAAAGAEARAGEAGSARAQGGRARSRRRPSAKQEARGGFWRDQVLTAKVQAKLQFNRRLWDASGGIQVAVRSGVATLTGVVPSREDIAEAEKIAAAVDGVTSVRNELRVGAPGLQPVPARLDELKRRRPARAPHSPSFSSTGWWSDALVAPSTTTSSTRAARSSVTKMKSQANGSPGHCTLS